MNPTQIAKDSESSHQKAFFAYCAVAHLHGFTVGDMWSQVGVKMTDEFKSRKRYPVDALEWIHAIPNGGARGDDAKTRAIRGGSLVAEGVRSGVADVFLPWPVACNERYHANIFPYASGTGFYCGLYIEFKKPALKPKSQTAKGGMSEEQIKFKEYCIKVGYAFKTCYTWQEGVETIKAYLGAA